jgi:hypothetical protein
MAAILGLLRSLAQILCGLCLVGAGSCAVMGALEWRQTAHWPQQTLAALIGLRHVRVERWAGVELVLNGFAEMSAIASLGALAVALFLLGRVLGTAAR